MGDPVRAEHVLKSHRVIDGYIECRELGVQCLVRRDCSLQKSFSCRLSQLSNKIRPQIKQEKYDEAKTLMEQSMAHAKPLRMCFWYDHVVVKVQCF